MTRVVIKAEAEAAIRVADLVIPIEVLPLWIPANNARSLVRAERL
jgi:hypothetical protein